MNHLVAFQPPHLNGLWQFATLNSRGGGPICGCSLDEGHPTREEAERHHWETATNHAEPQSCEELDVQRPCARCAAWTTHRAITHVHDIDFEHHVLCANCAAPLFEPASRLEAVRELVPFVPGREIWAS